jgi:hypothetical protein
MYQIILQQKITVENRIILFRLRNTHVGQLIISNVSGMLQLRKGSVHSLLYNTLPTRIQDLI